MHDQTIFIAEEELYDRGLVTKVENADPNMPSTKDNSLVMTLCVNQLCTNYGNLDRLFINDIRDLKQKVSELISKIDRHQKQSNASRTKLTAEEVITEKERILQQNRKDAIKAEALKEEAQRREHEKYQQILKDSEVRPKNVAIGGPQFYPSAISSPTESNDLARKEPVQIPNACDLTLRYIILHLLYKYTPSAFFRHFFLHAAFFVENLKLKGKNGRGCSHFNFWSA